MFIRPEEKPRRGAALGLTLVLACVVSLLVMSTVEDAGHEQVALSQGVEEAFKTGFSDNFNNNEGGWLGNQLDSDLDEDKALRKEVFAALGTQGGPEMGTVRSSFVQDSPSDTAQTLARFASQLSHKDAPEDDKVNALTKKAANLVRSRASQHTKHVVQSLARDRQELKRKLKRKLTRKLKVGLKKHLKTAASQSKATLGLASTLQRAKEGKNVERELQRVKGLMHMEKARIAEREAWLRSATPKDPAAVKQREREIATHKAQLVRLRYFLNRVQVEQQSHQVGAAVRRDGIGYFAPLSDDEDDVQDYLRSLAPGAPDPADAMDPRHWYTMAISGGPKVTEPNHSAAVMDAIDSAMQQIDKVEPPQSDAQRRALRSRISRSVRKEVYNVAEHVEHLGLSEAQEQHEIEKAIHKALVGAVSRNIGKRMHSLNKELNPNFGEQYVEEQARHAAEKEMIAARAKGKSDEEVSKSASIIAQRTAEVAMRQVAQTAAQSAAIRAAQMAANDGRGADAQKAAAQVAARAAVKRMVTDPSALRYLNKLHEPVLAGTADRGDRSARYTTARNAQQLHDVAHAGALGFPPTAAPNDASYDGSHAGLLMAAGSPQVQSKSGRQGLLVATGAPQVQSKSGREAAETQGVKSMGKEAKAVEQAGFPDKGSLGAMPGNATAVDGGPPTELQKKVQLSAAQIKADAAMKRAKAAAMAAQGAPPGPAGQKIIEQARLIAAEAARDVAEARMQTEMVKSGQGPKPLIHEAASQAVKIATPIATEVAAQSAGLQATIQAVAAAKKMMREQRRVAAHAAADADQVVQAADAALKTDIKSRIQKEVARAASEAAAATLKKGEATNMREAMITAAKQAAAKEVHQLEHSFLRKKIKDDSANTATKAAAAAKAAGAESEEVASIRTQAANTIRIDGEDALRDSRDDAKERAVEAAKKAGQQVKQKTHEIKTKEKADAKAAVAAAVDKLASGGNGARDSMKEAEEALRAEQALKPKPAAEEAATQTAQETQQQKAVSQAQTGQEPSQAAAAKENESFIQEEVEAGEDPSDGVLEEISDDDISDFLGF